MGDRSRNLSYESLLGESRNFFDDKHSNATLGITENIIGGSNNLCRRFAQILGSEILTSEPNLCAVTRKRNIDVTILGIPTQSPLVLNALFSFEPAKKGGVALNLGETVILQNEINPFISALRERDIKVTALHNHWLFEEPRLFYIHFESVEAPLSFATKVAEAFRLLEDGRLLHTDSLLETQ